MTDYPPPVASGSWGSDATKNKLTALALVVSILSFTASSFAAYRAHHADLAAQQAASAAKVVEQRLRKQSLDIATEDLANDLLQLSMPHLKDMRDIDDKVAEAACIVVVELSALQLLRTGAFLGE